MPAKRHGLYKSKDYVRWQNMLQRCARPNHPSYHRYGGRGITVCARWGVFENYLEDMGQCPQGLSLDRIDNNGPYSKENCRYTDKKTQMANKEQTVWITGFGDRLPRQEFCKKHKIGKDTLTQRMQLGATAEDAVRAVSKSFKLNVADCELIQKLYEGGSHRLSDLAEMYSVGTMTIHRVVKNKYWRAA